MSSPTRAPALPPTALDAGATTAIDTVFEALLADIVRGTYPAGARLPAERELARTLGASRPTLREALRRLGEWNLVEPRRGSGVVVRPMREWSLEVLPGVLRYGRPGSSLPSAARLLLDVISMRRSIVLGIIDLIATRLGGNGTEAGRAALARAWAVRRDPTLFPRADLEVMSAVCEAAGFVPGLWLLNRLSAIYLDVARSIAPAALPPDEYLGAYTRFFDALDRGDGEAASRIMRAWMEDNDRAITSALELLA